MYTQKDFANLQFNPLCKGKIAQEYPILCDIVSPDWSDTPFLDGIIRYSIMVYDPGSVLVAKEKDLNYRKGTAAELSGLSGREEEFITGIYDFTNTAALEFTVRYLIRFAKSKEWAAIVAYETSFWESIKKVMEPISGDNSKQELESVQKKSIIKDEIEKDIKRLDAHYSMFFGEDTELENRAKGRMTPESIAKLTK